MRILYSISSPKRGNDKTARFFPHLPRNAHVKAARVKLTDSLFITPDTTGGKWRCHGVADGFLNRRKGGMGCIRTTVRIQPGNM